MTAIRFWFAATLPITNDEAYYWDWGRQWQLSYLDHPSGVGWQAWLSQCLFSDHLAARGLAPIIHLLTVAGVCSCLTIVRASRSAIWTAVFVFELSPYFHATGFVLLPDAGLLLGMVWALYFALLIVQETHRISLGIFAGLGVALGIAGFYKYHAALFAIPLFICVSYQRRHGLLMDIGGWLTTVGIGLVCTFPVWLWNYQHEFASFVFQGSHGFGDQHLNLPSGGRVLLGQVLLVSPLVMLLVFTGWRAWYVQPANQQNRLLAIVGVPAIAFISTLAFLNESLPHWAVPFYLPLIVLYAGSMPRPILRWHVAYGATVGLLLVGLLTSQGLRQTMAESTIRFGNPSQEVTLWEPLANVVDAKRKTLETSCESPQLVSARWFWVAQLAFNLPDQPEVRILDPHRMSYYHFRDANKAWPDCLWLVAHADHVQRERFELVFDVESWSNLAVPAHASVPVVSAVLRLRDPKYLANFQPDSFHF